MELKSGLSAFVTGGASGIGRALCLALAKKGIFVTVVDTSAQKGEEVASLSQKENLKFHSGSLKFPSAIFVRCDVSNQGEVAAAFEKHVEVYGGLDICINCADIETSVPFYEDQTDGSKSWRHTVDVNLVAVIDCTHRAIKIMEAAKRPGVVINLGSASGLYPMTLQENWAISDGQIRRKSVAKPHFRRNTDGIRSVVKSPVGKFYRRNTDGICDGFPTEYRRTHLVTDYRRIRLTDGNPTDRFTDGLPTDSFTDGLPTDSFTDGLPTDSFTDRLPTKSFSDGLPMESYSDGLPTESIVTDCQRILFSDGLPTDIHTFS